MGRGWGFSTKISVWLYKMILLPQLMYADVVWRSRANRVEMGNWLTCLEGKFMSAATALMKSTPTDALKIALDLPPLDLFVVSKAESTPYTFVPEGTDSSGSGTNVMNWSTNGSGYKDCFGAGLYGPGENYKRSRSLGTATTVFQAEVLAIKKCSELLLSRMTTKKHLFVWSGSQAAIKALLKSSADSKLVWETMESPEKLGTSNKVTLAWVPGHEDIQGNEMGDGLAKQGAINADEATPVGLPHDVGVSHIKEKLRLEQSEQWKDTKICRGTRAIMSGPSQKMSKHLLAMNRKSEMTTTISCSQHMADLKTRMGGADSVMKQKRTVYTSYVTVRL
ncbi:uncharacterized protein [Fopius arisanus]|uniref:RNase H type-1 domain-containing protein n=1 Tax=Fopius arisanus TaxID=64838 RepID=A0A9R1SZG2_9HYME|nr:PREDICTED: uncharacterized protein LOC105264558 [Fopius arisanus]